MSKNDKHTRNEAEVSEVQKALERELATLNPFEMLKRQLVQETETGGLYDREERRRRICAEIAQAANRLEAPTTPSDEAA